MSWNELKETNEEMKKISFMFRRSTPEEPHDACRVHGSLTLNKVAGNFHITAGKVGNYIYKVGNYIYTTGNYIYTAENYN